MNRPRWKIVGGFASLAVVASLLVDYAVVRSKEQRLRAAVGQLGGRMYSIPLWPLGTEYRISFRRPLTASQLDRLSIANSMRGYVGILFHQCELTEAERIQTQRALSECTVMVEDPKSGHWLKITE